MGKSLEFIKERIKSCGTNGMENNKYNWIKEQTPFEVLKESLKLAIKDSILCDQIFEYTILNKDTFKVKIIYNPDAEYDYFSMQRCLSDGTYAHLYELMEICIENIINLKTYFKSVEIPKDLSGHTLIYTIGDFVLASETDKEKFKTEDKPWLDCRFTAMLPIKFEIK
jgi:hypothetical protein|nr:MAG TPA: hypothetical protein [Caudoviricetes sp.]